MTIKKCFTKKSVAARLSLTVCLFACLILGAVTFSTNASAADVPAGSLVLATDDDPEADRHTSFTPQEFEVLNDLLFSRSFKGASAGVSPFTGLTYTHADIFDDIVPVNGIDVSKYQPDIDWEAVRKSGVEFVIVRAGYRGYGAAGTLNTDDCFESHVEGALAAGLKVGLYFYTEATDTEEATQEAEYCINLAKDYDITLPIAYDYETTTVNGRPYGRKYDANLSKKKATANCEAFCDTIAAAGYTPMVYANRSDLTSAIDGEALSQEYKIWLANYTTQTPYTGSYEFWQYASNGRVDGISGNVDCNFWYTDDISALNSDAVSLNTAKFSSVGKQTYTGSAITPEPKLTLDGQTLVKDTDYYLLYSDNTAVGTATITAVGMGEFTGRVSKTFTIRPRAVSDFTASAGTKAVTLHWTGDDTVTGYQIFRKNTVNSSTYTKVKAFKKNTKVSFTETGLKKDREYFYRIRAYTTVDGKKYYSEYTDITGATLPGGKHAVVSKKAKLYTEPDLSGKAALTIPKNTQVTYLGRTYVKAKCPVCHVKVKIDGVSYSGYVSAETELKF